MKHASHLAARVAAVNRANAEANRLFPILAAAIAPFLGKKVVTAQGDRTQAFRKALDPLCELSGAQFPQAFVSVLGGYTVTLEVRTRESYGDHSCTYHDTAIYLGALRDGVLIERQNSFEPLRTDYSADEVARLRIAAEQARDTAREAESACNPFGLFDR